MSESVIVTISDARGATENKKAYCARGMRAWFKLHNLDFNNFIENGIDSEVLLATGDMMAEAAIKQARKRLANGQE